MTGFLTYSGDAGVGGGGGDASLAEQETQTASLATIIGHVNGVETALALLGTEAKLELIRLLLTGMATETTLLALGSLLTTVNENVGDIETLLGTTNTNVSDIEALVGTINTNIADIETALGLLSTEAKLEAVRALLAAILVVGGNVAHGGADSGNPLKVGGRVGTLDGTLPAALALGDRTDALWDPYGRLLVYDSTGRMINKDSIAQAGINGRLVVLSDDFMTFTVCPVKQAVVNLSADGEVLALVAAKKIRVLAISVSVSAALTLEWRSGGAAGTVIVPAMAFAANGGWAANRMPHGFLFETVAGENLYANQTGAGDIRGTMNYIEV